MSYRDRRANRAANVVKCEGEKRLTSTLSAGGGLQKNGAHGAVDVERSSGEIWKEGDE